MPNYNICGTLWNYLREVNNNINAIQGPSEPMGGDLKFLLSVTIVEIDV